MSTIKEFAQRDWNNDKFHGELLNTAGKKDTGGPYMDYLEELQERSKKENCAQVLSSTPVLSMPQAVKQDLTLRLSQLEATLPMTDRIREKQERIRKHLSDELLRQERLDNYAAKVLSIMNDISAPNVARLIQQTTRPFKSNFNAALTAILELQQTLYFDHAYARKTQADEMISKVGVAHTAPQLLMLIGQLEGLFEKILPWFHRTQPDGTLVLYDPEVPFYGQAQRVRFLQERLSSKSPNMNPYRAIVSQSIAAGDAFAVVIDTLKTSVRSDVQSLDDDPHSRETEKVFMAKVLQSNQEIFQEGIDFEKSQALKRQRIIHPISNAQCNFWDGNSCDFELKTHKPCKYSDHHAPGKNTFKHPFQKNAFFEVPSSSSEK